MCAPRSVCAEGRARGAVESAPASSLGGGTSLTNEK